MTDENGVLVASSADLADLETRHGFAADEDGRIAISPAPGIELGYAQITSDAVQTGAGNNSPAGLQTTVTVGQRPIIVELTANQVYQSSASGISTIAIQQDGVTVAAMSITLTNTRFPLNRRVRLAPAAGDYTYSVNILQAITGNTTIYAAATDPAAIHVVEV